MDMGISKASIAFLSASGHDAVHLRDAALLQLSDAEILQKLGSNGAWFSLTTSISAISWRPAQGEYPASSSFGFGTCDPTM